MGRALVWLAVLGALGAGGAWAWPRLQAQVFKTEVRTLEVASVSPSQASTSVSATGYVVALTLSRVQPRTYGRVARVTVREGDAVRAGQVLLEIDGTEQRAAIAASQARADLPPACGRSCPDGRAAPALPGGPAVRPHAG